MDFDSFCATLIIMNKIKYISLEKLRKRLKKVIEDVFRSKSEYIVMINNEPKVKISAVDSKEGKELVVEREIEQEKLKEFIK